MKCQRKFLHEQLLSPSCRLEVLACALLLTACTNSGRLVPSTQPASSQTLVYVSLFNGSDPVEVYAPPRSTPVAALGPPDAAFGASDSAGNAYVLSVGTTAYPNGAVLVYPRGGTKPIRTITDVAAPVAADVAGDGTLYVGNACGAGGFCDFGNNGPTGSVWVFPPNASSPAVQHAGEQPFGFAFGSNGSLFVLNADNSVIGEYAWVDWFARHAKRPKRFWLDEPSKPKQLSSFVVDGSGQTIYAAYERGNGYVDAYDGLAKAPRKITTGILHPAQLAVNAAHDLLVANARSVAVYAPGASTPKRTIANGIDGPHILLVTQSGQLDVLNASSLSAFARNGAKPVYNVPTGYVQSAAVDASGNLYAISSRAHSSAFTLSEYAASTGKKLWSTLLTGATSSSTVSVGN